MRERDMLDLLRTRYTRIRPGTNADRYVRAEHARAPWISDYGYGYGQAAAKADYVVIDTYGHGAVIGHEVKVSRSDWLTELRNPAKSEVWRRYCHQWYLVCPDPSIVRDDLPDGWGLMTLTRGGALRVKVAAPVNLSRQELPLMAAAQLARAIAQTAVRECAAAAATPEYSEGETA